MRNISDTSCRENQNTHFVFIFSKNHAMYEIMWKSTVEPDWPQMTVYYSTCTLHAGWVRLQTHTQNM